MFHISENSLSRAFSLIIIDFDNRAEFKDERTVSVVRRRRRCDRIAVGRVIAAVHAGIEVVHGAVVIAPRVLDVILGFREIAQQIQEALVGLDLGIGFRDRDQAPQIVAERSFGAAL